MSARTSVWLAVVTLSSVAIYISSHAFAQQDENAPPDGTQRESEQNSAERGEYIVHHVAMCIYCHTPRDKEGTPDMRQLLRGAPMPINSPFPRQTWAFQAPKIAGLPGGWTEDDMARFLQTGVSPTGYQPRLPMPPFRMNDEDARAVAAYLRSL